MKKKAGLIICALIVMCIFGAHVTAAEKIHLDCYSYGIQKHNASIGTKMLLDRVKERWSGNFDYKLYYADTIIKTSQALDAINSGIIDTVTATTSYFTGKVPIGDAYLMPFAHKGLNNLVEFAQNPEVIEIMNRHYVKAANAMVLSFLPMGESQIFAKSPAITKINDFKGRKLRCPGGSQGEFIVGIGASPVTIPSSEVYMAAQRGIVDSAVYAVWAIEKLKLWEVLDSVIVSPPYQAYGVPIFINKDKWESFPEDLKKIFMETARETEKDFIKIVQKEQEKGEKAGKEHGMKFISFSPEEAAKFKSAVEPVYKKWADKIGPDGERMLQLMGLK